VTELLQTEYVHLNLVYWEWLIGTVLAYHVFGPWSCKKKKFSNPYLKSLGSCRKWSINSLVFL
jgi:hypothetical protein